MRARRAGRVGRAIRRVDARGRKLFILKERRPRSLRRRGGRDLPEVWSTKLKHFGNVN